MLRALFHSKELIPVHDTRPGVAGYTAGLHERGRKLFVMEPGRRQVACAKNEVSFMFFDNFEISLSYSFLLVY